MRSHASPQTSSSCGNAAPSRRRARLVMASVFEVHDDSIITARNWLIQVALLRNRQCCINVDTGLWTMSDAMFKLFKAGAHRKCTVFQTVLSQLTRTLSSALDVVKSELKETVVKVSIDIMALETPSTQPPGATRWIGAQPRNACVSSCFP
jgi:hypothetical protein